MQGKPRQGPGKRHMDCDLYEKCLDLAAKKDWDSFNCEGCTYQEKGPGNKPATPEKKENTRICEDCQEKVTLSPNCPYCPSCMAKRSNRAGSAKKGTKAKKPRSGPSHQRATERPVVALKEEKATQRMPKPEKPLSGPNTAITIEFGQYENILRRVEGLAEEEMRPVGLQVIYMLKKSLAGIAP